MKGASAWALAALASCGWGSGGQLEPAEDATGESSGGEALQVLGDGPWAECTWEQDEGAAVSETLLACPFNFLLSDTAELAYKDGRAFLQVASPSTQGLVQVGSTAVELIDAAGPVQDANLHFVDAQGRLSQWRRGVGDSGTSDAGTALALATYDGSWSHTVVAPDATDFAALTALPSSSDGPLLGVVDLNQAVAFQVTPQGVEKTVISDLSTAVGWDFGADTDGQVFVAAFRPWTEEVWQLEAVSATGAPFVFGQVDVWDIGPVVQPRGRAPATDGTLTAAAAFFEREAQMRVYTSGAGEVVVPRSVGPDLSGCSMSAFEPEAFEACSSRCEEELEGRTSRGVASSWVDERHVLLAFMRSRISHEITLWESCAEDGFCNCSYDQRIEELEAVLDVMRLDVQTGQFEEVFTHPLSTVPGVTFSGRHGISMSVDGADVAVLVSDDLQRARILQFALEE